MRSSDHAAYLRTAAAAQLTEDLNATAVLVNADGLLAHVRCSRLKIRPPPPVGGQRYAAVPLPRACGGAPRRGGTRIAHVTVRAPAQASFSAPTQRRLVWASYFFTASGLTGVNRLISAPSGSRKSSERLPHGCVVGA